MNTCYVRLVHEQPVADDSPCLAAWVPLCKSSLPKTILNCGSNSNSSTTSIKKTIIVIIAVKIINIIVRIVTIVTIRIRAVCGCGVASKLPALSIN